MEEYIVLGVRERLQLLRSALTNAETQRFQAELNLRIMAAKIKLVQSGQQRNEIQATMAVQKQLAVDLAIAGQITQAEIERLESEAAEQNQ